MFHMACIRMYIILGGSLDELIACYINSVSVHKNPARAEKLRKYEENRQLVDGLYPLFDSNFPPDYVIDFGVGIYCQIYGGSSSYSGMYIWINSGKMKYPVITTARKKQ